MVRDKRGYETTYLMHWFREGGRQRSKILYAFRSPGASRVGRSALEPEIRHRLEFDHPDIAFDWPAIREHQQVIEPAPDLRRRRPHRDVPPEPPSEPGIEPDAGVQAGASSPGVVVSRPPVPTQLEGATPDEQMAFLARWYPIVRERITLRTLDPVRQEALLAVAERLNPGAWTDADQVASGLAQAAETMERLSHLFARRRRRGPRRTSGSLTAPDTESGDTE